MQTVSQRDTQLAASLSKHNTSVSSFNFCICQLTLPICLHLHNKRKKTGTLDERWNSSSDSVMWPTRKKVRVFAITAGTVEDGVKLVISLVKRLLCAADDSLARTLVSLRFHSRTTCCCCCVCVCARWECTLATIQWVCGWEREREREETVSRQVGLNVE